MKRVYTIIAAVQKHEGSVHDHRGSLGELSS